MNIRISGASEQNGDAAREVNRAYTLKICLSGMRGSAYNSWIFRRKILSMPRVIFNKKLCEPNGMQYPILRPRSVPYVHQQSRILYLQ